MTQAEQHGLQRLRRHQPAEMPAREIGFDVVLVDGEWASRSSAFQPPLDSRRDLRRARPKRGQFLVGAEWMNLGRPFASSVLIVITRSRLTVRR
jgi:hypothetical protein